MQIFFVIGSLAATSANPCWTGMCCTVPEMTKERNKESMGSIKLTSDFRSRWVLSKASVGTEAKGLRSGGELRHDMREGVRPRSQQ